MVLPCLQHFSMVHCSLVCEHGNHLLLSSLLAHLKSDLLESEPFLALGVLLDEDGGLLDDLADWSLLLGGRLSSCGVLLDLGVSGFVVVLEGFALELLLPSGELSLEGFWIFLLDEIIVLLDMDTKDVLPMLFSSEDSLGFWTRRVLLLASLTSFLLNLLDTMSWESLLVVWNVEATVASSLHGTEDTVSSGSANETNIEVGLERSSFTHVVLD